jgi:hypothetical protein
MTRYLVLTEAPCFNCAGDGFLRHAAWQECANELGDDLGSLSAVSGDAIADWFGDQGYSVVPPECTACPVCNGAGVVRDTVTLRAALRDLLNGGEGL